MPNRRVARALSTTLFASLMLTACVDSRVKTAAGETGGTMIIVVPVDPGTLFPPRAAYSQELAVVASVFDRLAEIAPDLSTYGDAGFTPRLAQSWDWANDSLSIAFHLDPAAKWHDGAPVRAVDVQYTFHAYTSAAVASPYTSLLGNIDSVSVRDSLTAVVWFKRRTPQQFMDATYTMFILPSHILASIPDDSLSNAPFSRAPVGTGRFRFAKWEAGTRLEIIADTANSRGRAKLDRVIWTFVSDMGAATIKLFSGEADFLEQILAENIPQVASSPNLRLEMNLPLAYGYVGFNLNARRAKPGSRNTPHPIFGDPRVRRALNMAVDRDKIVRTVLDSLGMVSFGPAPRALIPDTSALRAIPFNVAAANALLDSAGWTDTNGDGVRDHDGVPLAFELMSPSSSVPRVKMSVLIQAALSAVGAQVTLQTLEGSVMGPRIEARDFDAFINVWQPNPGLQGMRQTWVSRGTNNYQGYNNPVFDALVDSALTTFDANRSKGYWTRAFQTSIDDAPSIWLYEQRLPLAVHKRIQIGRLRADGWYANLADWTIDPAQQIDRDKIGLGGAR